MADWSILQQPNFAQAALSGYQAGQAIGRQRRLDAALGSVDLERPETIMPVIQADPTTGTALLGAASRMAQYKHDLAGKAALTDYILAQKGLSAAAGSAQSPSDDASTMPSVSGSAAPANANANGADGGDIVVTGQRPGLSLEQARVNLIKADPDTYIKTETALAGMDKAQRENIAAANDTFGSSIEAARQMPYAQRKAYIQNIRPQLIAHGVPPEMIDSFDPTDGNIDMIENQVLGVKGIIEKQDKDRNFALSQQREARETAQGNARIGIAEGALSVARQRESREAKKATGGAGDVSSATTDALLQAAGLR